MWDECTGQDFWRSHCTYRKVQERQAGGGAEITKDLLPGINYMEESPVGATTFHHHYLRSGKNHQK